MGWGSEGKVISVFFTNWGGSNLFYSQLGEGQLFLERKKLHLVASLTLIC